MGYSPKHKSNGISIRPSGKLIVTGLRARSQGEGEEKETWTTTMELR